MSRRSAFGTLILTAVAYCAWPAPASAAVLITRGETIKHVADIPSPEKENLQADLLRIANRNVQPAVGFAYKYWGIFWIDFWTWDGRFCIYEDKTLYGEPPVA